MRRSSSVLLLGLAFSVAPSFAAGQPTRVTTPRQELGHDFGADYFLANYRQIAAYWQKLDRESDRMVLRDIGRTAEGRPHYMAIVTSPENHRRLEHYRQLSRRLALAEGLTDQSARTMAAEGKAIVWIDGGLHATETLGAQQLGEMVYQMVSRTDPETMRILDEVIILFVHANPDGNDLVADWYMRRPDTLERSTAGIPRLYQKYIGHDNNRDFYMLTQKESQAVNQILYHRWFPQIFLDGRPAPVEPTVLFAHAALREGLARLSDDAYAAEQERVAPGGRQVTGN